MKRVKGPDYTPLRCVFKFRAHHSPVSGQHGNEQDIAGLPRF